MSRLARCALASSFVVLVAVVPQEARAATERADTVRLNATMPVGGALGDERLHGYVWGLRGALGVFPDSDHVRIGFGPYGEWLKDGDQHALWALGGEVAVAPIIDAPAWRFGGFAGAARHDAAAPGWGASWGFFTQVAIPVAIYDFRMGLRVAHTSIGGHGGTSVLVDFDVVGMAYFAFKMFAGGD